MDTRYPPSENLTFSHAQGRHQRVLLSRPTPRRPTPITRTALVPFMVSLDANAEGGASHHEHGQNRGVHGALVSLLGFFRWSKGVACVQRQRSQRFSIHMSYVRPRSPKGHLGEGGR